VAALIDAHYSLVVLRMPTLSNVGFILPGFVLTSGLFFGGRVATSQAHFPDARACRTHHFWMRWRKSGQF
jgi:hypothetical protein